MVPALTLLALGHQRRWMSDDGLIVVRAVRSILAGDGPNFIAGERVETSTSTLWQWLVAAGTAVSGADPAVLAVYGGLVLAAAGVGLAVAGTMRLHREQPARSPGIRLPAGVVVYLAVPAAWDYATSGLETGLEVCWVGASWLALVRASPGAGRRARVAVAVLLGSGVLVRPDLALVVVPFFAGYVLLTRSTVRAAALLAAAGAALPLAYEVFRAGYYGLLVPMPAITKEAGASDWGRGWDYVADTVGPYWLVVPLVVVAVLLVGALRRTDGNRRTAVLTAVPVASSALLVFFAVRVGGDWMHARMLLVPLLLLLLPVLVVPVRPATVAAVAVIGGWAVVALSPLRQPFDGPSTYSVQNVRHVSRQVTGMAHPVSQRDWIEGFASFGRSYRANATAPPGTLVLGYGDETMRHPLRPDARYPVVHIGAYLGLAGAAVPLDHGIVDLWSLSNPLGSHLETSEAPSGATQDLAGHEKQLPSVWILALWADPAAPMPPPGHWTAAPEAVAAARRVLECEPVRELLASTQARLTPGRFWSNLTGSLRRTTLRIPRDPFVAEQELCR